MDRELNNKNKIDISGQEKPAASPAPDFGGAAIGAYNPQLTQQAWDQSHKPWSASPQGRLAIRAFSRGIMGAAFFTAGGLLTRRWMHSDTGGRYVLDEPWSKQIDPRQGGNPLKFIAKLIDTVVGKPIELTVNALGGDGKRAVRFRSTKFTGDFPKSGYRGRGLGNEAVTVTFDFFCASVGDAWGRDIAGWFDPNVKKKWMKDGHVNFPEAIKQALKSVTHYITYNGGEDWAVAVPYVYFMRAHRDFMNYMSPGFHYDNHRNLNGGSFKVNRNHDIVGNFNLEGAADLHNRFVGYNIGTLMFREMWDYLGKKIKGEHAVLYGDPDPAHDRKRGLGEKTGNLFKWMARAAVKAGIYMQFAVPFFWITRAPQNNYRGIFIKPDQNAMLCYEDAQAHGSSKIEVVHANDLVSGKVTAETPVFWATHEPVRGNPNAKQFRRVSGELTGAASPIARWGGKKFQPYHPDLVHNPVDKGLQISGRVNRKLASGMDKVTAHFEDSVLAKPMKKMMGLNVKEGVDKYGRKVTVDRFPRFNHGFVNAAVSYTPYMYMKAEAARFWDDGKMDVAAERMIDGATRFNWGEFKAGAGEVWHAFLHQPFADPRREQAAEHRKRFDTSLTDSVNLDSSHARAKRAEALSWRERTIQGEKPEVGADHPKSHAEREEMREALKDLQPPTPSIN